MFKKKKTKTPEDREKKTLLSQPEEAYKSFVVNEVKTPSQEIYPLFFFSFASFFSISIFYTVFSLSSFFLF
jgi:hypothetical protein